ncbi:MAG: MMPL family transporter [Candidatus Methanomethylophilaceae archaeon]|nr:MMPL family transporter [Candidatus Methanomethylophilaceae archaeon]
MLLDKVADVILRHSKVIIAIWIIALLVSVPLALRSGEVMRYDTGSMLDEDSEALQGLVVMGTDFPTSAVDVSSIQVLVVHFEDERGRDLAEQFISFLDMYHRMYLDAEGRPLLGYGGHGFMNMAENTAEDGSGIALAAVLYSGNPHVSLSDDTGNLREFIGGMFERFKAINPAASSLDPVLTGSPAIGYDTSQGALEDLARIDPFTVLTILVLVGLFFRSFVTSATPPVAIGFAFAITLGLIFIIGQYLNIFFITEVILLVSMMGAGCDYCIFITARYREKFRESGDHEQALREAIVWAGESIATSGASVIIGVGVLGICSFSMISTMGISLAIGIVLALLAALTLMPSVLNITGDRIFWPTRMREFEEGGKATRGWYGACSRFGTRYFEKSSLVSRKYAKVIVIAAVIVSLPAAYVALTSEQSYDMVSAMQTGESGEGMDYITEYADSGMFMPNNLVVEYASPVATVGKDPFSGYGTLVWTDRGTLEGIWDLMSDISADGNVAYVNGPFSWADAVENAKAATGTSDPATVIEHITSEQSGYVRIVLEGLLSSLPVPSSVIVDQSTVYAPIVDYMVNIGSGSVGGSFIHGGSGIEFVNITYTTVDAAMSARSMKSIGDADGLMKAYVSENADKVGGKWVTGSPAIMYEVSVSVGDEFGKIEVLAILLILVLLFVVMRSYTIPFRSILTILMSISWTLTATHLVFTVLLGIEILWMLPLILLVICLGLGMDYDILLTTRIKENVIRGMSNAEAIHSAVMSTGSVITICGLIMGGAFGTLMISSMDMLTQFGFALCFAILVDALVVRTYIVPAVMFLLGRYNWVGPGRKGLGVEDTGSDRKVDL